MQREVLDDQRAHLAFAQVGAGGLPALVAVEVQHVVCDLEEQADGAHLTGQRVGVLQGQPGQTGGSVHGKGEERGRLAFDGFAVRFPVESTAGQQIELGGLPTHDFLGVARQGVCKRPANRVGGLHAGDRAVGEHQHQVADVDGLVDAVPRPHRRAPSTHGVAVLDVVVDEGRVVQELGGGCPRNGVDALAAEGLQGGERESGAQALPAGGEVFAGEDSEPLEPLSRRELGHLAFDVLQVGVVPAALERRVDWQGQE